MLRFLLAAILFLPKLSFASFELNLENYNYPEYKDEQIDDYEFRGSMYFKKDFELLENLKLRFEPGVRASTIYEESAYFDPQELLFEVGVSNFYLQMGYLKFPSEGTDIINPMDIVAMRDDRDPLNPHSLSSAGLRLGGYFDYSEISIFFIPNQIEPKSFDSENPWLPRSGYLPIQTDELELRLPNRINYQFNDLVELDDALKNNFGFRFTQNWNAFDFTIAGFEGATQNLYMSPIIDVSPIATNPKPIFELLSPVTLQPIVFKRRTGSALIMYTAESSIFRFAIRDDKTLSDDDRVPDGSYSFVTGIEKALGDLTLLLHYTKTDFENSSSLTNIMSLLNEGILFGVRKPLNDKNLIQAGGFHALNSSTAILQLQWDYSINSNFKFAIQGDYIDGPDDEFLGLMNDRKRINFKMTYLN